MPFTKIRPVPYSSGSRRRAQSPFLPPYSPELNPKENIWHEIREKIFKNYALKSIDAVRAKLDQAILYLELNPGIVKSITGFPYIINSP